MICCCFLGIWILLDKRSFNGYFRICGKHVKNAILEILRKSLKKYYESNLRNTTEVKETQTFQFQRAFTEFHSFQKEFTFFQEGCHLAPIGGAFVDCDVGIIFEEACKRLSYTCTLVKACN